MKKKSTLHDLRKEISILDIELIKLIAKRSQLALKTEKQKRGNGDDIHVPATEKKKQKDLRKTAEEIWQNNNSTLHIEEIFKAIFKESRRLQNIQRKSAKK